MPLSLIGSYTVNGPGASTDPQDWTIELPFGSQVGDLAVLTWWAPGGVSTSDPRLTDLVPAGAGYAGAYGILTDLADIEYTTVDGIANGMSLFVLRAPGIGVASRDYQEWAPTAVPSVVVDSSTPGMDSAHVAIIWVGDQLMSPGFDFATVPSGGVTVTGDAWPGPNPGMVSWLWTGDPPVPDISVGADTGYTDVDLRWRALLVLEWNDTVPGLRVRQIIPPERVRGRIPPERVRQIIP